MKTLLSSTLALSIVLGLNTGSATADDNGRLLEALARFKELDANLNGELSMREFKRHLAGEAADKAELLFGRLDKDYTRSLTFDEFKLGFKRN